MSNTLFSKTLINSNDIIEAGTEGSALVALPEIEIDLIIPNISEEEVRTMYEELQARFMSDVEPDTIVTNNLFEDSRTTFDIVIDEYVGPIVFNEQVLAYERSLLASTSLNEEDVKEYLDIVIERLNTVTSHLADYLGTKDQSGLREAALNSVLSLFRTTGEEAYLMLNPEGIELDRSERIVKGYETIYEQTGYVLNFTSFGDIAFNSNATIAGMRTGLQYDGDSPSGNRFVPSNLAGYDPLAFDVLRIAYKADSEIYVSEESKPIFETLQNWLGEESHVGYDSLWSKVQDVPILNISDPTFTFQGQAIPGFPPMVSLANLEIVNGQETGTFTGEDQFSQSLAVHEVVGTTIVEFYSIPYNELGIAWVNESHTTEDILLGATNQQLQELVQEAIPAIHDESLTSIEKIINLNNVSGQYNLIENSFTSFLQSYGNHDISQIVKVDTAEAVSDILADNGINEADFIRAFNSHFELHGLEAHRLLNLYSKLNYE